MRTITNVSMKRKDENLGKERNHDVKICSANNHRNPVLNLTGVLHNCHTNTVMGS